MSRMSAPAGSIAVPFMLRRKQSLTRYSIVSTVPLRGRYLWIAREHAHPRPVLTPSLVEVAAGAAQPVADVARQAVARRGEKGAAAPDGVAIGTRGNDRIGR